MSLLQSPVVATVSETLEAVSTIKAYQAEDFFLHRHEDLLDSYNAASTIKSSLDTYITLRAQLISAILVLSGGMLNAYDVISKAQAGLALSTAITFTSNVYLLLWALITVEVEMNSVERLKYYVDEIPSEEDELDVPVTGNALMEPNATWPEHGNIILSNVCVRYRSRKDLALDHINLSVTSGQRIGIVGRTGMLM